MVERFKVNLLIRVTNQVVGADDLCDRSLNHRPSLTTLLQALGKALVLAALLTSVAPSAQAQKINHDLKICGGKPGGTYIKAAEWLAQQLRGVFKSVEVIESQGSIYTHLKMVANECDIGLAQGDSLPFFAYRADQLAIEFSVSSPGLSIGAADIRNHRPVSLLHEVLKSENGLYSEKVHLMCNRELGRDFTYRRGGSMSSRSQERVGLNDLEDLITYISEVAQNGPSSRRPMPVVYLGPTGGGGHATYFAMSKAHPELDRENGGPEAISIDETDVLNNGVAAGLYKTFREPHACFVYVSRVPHEIINLLDGFGGPGTASAGQRIETENINGQPVQRFYFEGVKLLSSSTEDLLKLKGPDGNRLFGEGEAEQNYPMLRAPDDGIDTSRNFFYGVASRPTKMLTVQTQLFATEEIFGLLNQNQDANYLTTLRRVLADMQRRDGNF